MREKPHRSHRLEWPGGVVPEWARPQGNPNKRFGKGRGGGGKRERLQKIMAQSGYGSRRNIEILIAQGHITVNGQPAKLGDSVGPGDRVKLDGRLINLRFGEPMPRVLLYHKPEGEIVTRDDPEGRATVFEKLPKVQGGRWVSVGRLDINTGGLLIFTTSGELANRLMHPRFEVEREYAVRLLGELTEERKAKLLEGIEIEGESCKFDSIEDRGGEGANHWYHVVLREGKNREVRRMFDEIGITVSRLMRVRYGSVALPGFLKRGMMREMNEEEVQELLAFAGMGSTAAPGEDEEIEEEDDNIGNRIGPAPRAERAHEPDGNRAPAGGPPLVEGNHGGPFAEGNHGSSFVEGNRAGPLVEGNRAVPPAAPGPGGARRPGRNKPPFFKKRGKGGQGQGQGQGQGKPHGQGQGNAAVQQPRQGHPAGEGVVPRGPAPGPGKPGRNRRNKNRNRNRGAASPGNEAQPAGNANRDPY